MPAALRDRERRGLQRPRGKVRVLNVARRGRAGSPGPLPRGPACRGGTIVAVAQSYARSARPRRRAAQRGSQLAGRVSTGRGGGRTGRQLQQPGAPHEAAEDARLDEFACLGAALTPRGAHRSWGVCGGTCEPSRSRHSALHSASKASLSRATTAARSSLTVVVAVASDASRGNAALWRGRARSPTATQQERRTTATRGPNHSCSRLARTTASRCS